VAVQDAETRGAVTHDVKVEEPQCVALLSHAAPKPLRGNATPGLKRWGELALGNRVDRAKAPPSYGLSNDERI